MPRYPFRCRVCGQEFEVSRRMSDAGQEAACPLDGEPAERVFTAPVMAFRRPPESRPRPTRPASGYSHFGHSHGPGTGTHSH